ncbi:hypothetical protein C2G38_2235759 [Gigaspora rosea]|uniref:Uncharacterized protein n=1 Tax=Gigaspora rosea TaxID=44941 RepID=A0A397TQ90_9GLOM|nr:hypothetical protein C2G38_2235759 [Gigaspora rosea]
MERYMVVNTSISISTVSSNHNEIFIGISIGTGVIILIALIEFLLYKRRRQHLSFIPTPGSQHLSFIPTPGSRIENQIQDKA